MKLYHCFHNTLWINSLTYSFTKIIIYMTTIPMKFNLKAISRISCLYPSRPCPKSHNKFPIQLMSLSYFQTSLSSDRFHLLSVVSCKNPSSGCILESTRASVLPPSAVCPSCMSPKFMRLVTGWITGNSFARHDGDPAMKNCWQVPPEKSSASRAVYSFRISSHI